MNKTFATKDIEKKLGKKLRKNVSCIGLDLASTTGLAIIRVKNGETRIYSDKVKVSGTQSKDNLTKKLDNLIDFLQEVDTDIFGISKDDTVIIENSYLGINTWTYGILRLMAGVTYKHYYDLEVKDIRFLFATQSRKIVGFKKSSPKINGNSLKREVIEFISSIIGEKVTHDEADAVILAFAGLIEGE